MALTKENKIEKIEIVGEYKAIQVKVLHPDSDITNEDQEVKDVSNIVWTDLIKTAWTNYQASSKGD